MDWESTYRENRHKLYCLCLRIVEHPGVAEELVQETFLRAWQNYEKFEGRSGMGTWLHRIAVNNCLMWKRKKQRDTETMRDFDSVAATRATDPVLHIDLTRAIAELPRGYRENIIMTGIWGYEHGEVGEMRGTSRGCSKSQGSRAKARVRAMMAGGR